MSNSYLDLLAQFGIGGAHPGGFPLTEQLLKEEPIRASTIVLDVGCGTGQTSAFLNEHFGCEVIAIDNHPLMVEKAKQRLKWDTFHGSVLKEDVEKLSFKEKTIDFIIAESVVTFTDIPTTLKELYRVLRKNGCLFMIEMTAEQPLPSFLKEKVTHLYGVKKILLEEEWKHHLQEAGFSNIEVIPTPLDLKPTSIMDMNPTENIKAELYDLWDKHNALLTEASPYLGYRVFRCTCP